MPKNNKLVRYGLIFPPNSSSSFKPSLRHAFWKRFWSFCNAKLVAWEFPSFHQPWPSWRPWLHLSPPRQRGENFASFPWPWPRASGFPSAPAEPASFLAQRKAKFQPHGVEGGVSRHRKETSAGRHGVFDGCFTRTGR